MYKILLFFNATSTTSNRFSDFFGVVRTFTIQKIYSGDLSILFLNQLNGYHPFDSCVIGKHAVTSSFDGCINCNPLGPDCILDYSILYQDPLSRTALEQSTLTCIPHTVQEKITNGRKVRF